MMNIFNVFTIFPDMFQANKFGIVGRAQQAQLIKINPIDIRDFSTDKHKKTDDYPFGGGVGMLMTCQPIFDAFSSVNKAHSIYMSPRGKILTQKRCKELSKLKEINILCGHYEGVDQRVVDELIDEEISCGDYVLTGGEIPAMLLIDCISRLIPNVLAQKESHQDESFEDNLLECNQYTRPADYKGLLVPDILLSGHHKNIAQYQLAESIYITLLNRPDLLEKRKITKEEFKIFNTYYSHLKDDIIKFIK